MNIQNITESEYIRNHREEVQRIINDGLPPIVRSETVVDLRLISTKFTAKISTIKDLNEAYWPFTNLTIIEDGVEIISMNRNYSSIDYCYAKQNDIEYIITSEDYQCFTIIDLTNRTINTYGSLERIKHGIGWCPIDFEWDPSENVLKCTGCYWGGDYQIMRVVIPDLSNPDFNLAEYHLDPQYDDDDEDDEDD